MNNQLIKRKPINKILVVGHPLSGYGAVETLLNSCGMTPPQPSRRDRFLPAEISMTLCKAHQVSPVDPHSSGAEIEQVEVGPIWNGMALDLLLGNIDQELWGWADPQAVYLLDYWKALDPRLAFVLVYDTPEQLIARAFDEKTQLSPEALQRVTRNWSVYNAALLHFYHRNADRCLLVHAQQVRESASTYLQQVRTRIGAPVLADRPDTVADTALELAPRSTAATQQDALKAYIAHALIQQQPDTMQLYEELQSVANLPLTEQDAAPYTPLDAWLSMATMQTYHADQSARAQVHAQAQDAQIQAIGKRLNGAEALAGERQQHIDQLEKAQSTSRQQAQEQQQENELLLLQLHQVQEELERNYLEGQQQKEKVKALQETEKLAAERAAQNEQLKKQLATQTQLVQAQAEQIKGAASKPPAINPEHQQENELLLLQLHQVQEELERYYLENQKLKQKPTATAKPPKPVYYGAADRVKRQLSYRLGATMISQSRSFSGCLSMPLALLKQVREFRLEKKAQGDARLPSIMNYADAFEAERVKQHLSYRLGAALIAHGKTPLGWIKLPFALRREVKAFRQQRQA